MKLTANLSLLFTEVPFLQRFARAREAGFEAVEMQFPYDTPISDIRAELDKHKLTCVLINVPAGDLMEGGEGLASVPGKEAEFAAALAECVSYAASLRVSCVNVLPGRCLDESRRPFYMETFRRNLEKAAETFSPLGVTITFEAINTYDMPGFLIHSVEQMKEVMANAEADNIRMQFDVYHMARMEQGDIGRLITQLGDDIGHIQFADVPGRGEPGSGTLDFGAVFHAIERSSYKGWIGAEYKPTRRTQDTLIWKKALASGVAMCS